MKRKFEPNEWVSATKLRNFAINDPLCDYLDLYEKKDEKKDEKKYKVKTSEEPPKKKPRLWSRIKKNVVNTFQDFIFKKGELFEKMIWDKLQNKRFMTSAFGSYFSNVMITKSKYIDIYKAYDDTISNMKKGTEIIYQGVVCNHENNTYGIPDLLIRHDVFEQIFQRKITMEVNNKFAHGFNYLIIDVKSSTLQIASNGINFHNNCNGLAIKSQLYVYLDALNGMQGGTFHQAYVLSNNRTEHQLGHIATVDYSSYDAKYKGMVAKGIEWIRRLRTEGKNWKLFPKPSIPELYPNQKISNFRWDGKKNMIADKLNDITKIWMCGPKQRQIAHHRKIYSWKNPKCTASLLGFKAGKIHDTVDLILNVNRQKQNLYLPRSIPKHITSECKQIELFVDFETIGPMMTPDKNERIFMIGVGMVKKSIWSYKCLVANDLKPKSEMELIDSFFDFVKSMDCRIFHWSDAEINMMNRANLRHQNRWKNEQNDTQWLDFMKVMKNEPIVIKGAFNFSLKSIGKAMYQNRMIDKTWDCTCENGLDCMVIAKNLYSQNKFDRTHPDMVKMIHYNETDCMMIWKIIQYFRNL